jgi:hypothetical protein
MNILIQEEIRRRLNSANACYHSVQDLLCSCLHVKLVSDIKGDEVTVDWRKLQNEELHN